MIRVILTLCLFVVGANVYSQAPLIIRNDGKTTALDSNLFVGKSFRPPAFNDTTQANQSIKVLDSSGRVIFTRDSSTLWVRNVGKYWQKLVSGSGVVTLQQAFNAAPTANPDINAGGNTFSIAGDNNSGGVSRIIVGNNQGAQLYSKLDNTSYVNAKADGTIEISSASTGSNSQKLVMNESKSYLVSGGNSGSDTSLTKLGIGTLYPEAPLDVSGAPRFRTPSAQDGYVWTAINDKGDGEWEASSTVDSSTYFTTFRADTMRNNIYSAIGSVPTPTLQQSFNVSSYPQIDFTNGGLNGKFSIYTSGIDNSKSGLFMDEGNKSFLLGDSTKSQSYLEVNTASSITLITPDEIIFNPDSSQAGYVWTSKNTSGEGEWRPSSAADSSTYFTTFRADTMRSNLYANKVPYIGAYQDVDLGAFKLNAQAVHIKGTAGNGHLGLKHQSAAATASGNESSLYANSNGDIAWKNDNLYLTTLKTSGNTADRVYTFPDSTGTVALLSNVNAKQDTSTAWKTSGNFGVNAGQFIGSRNNASIRFRVNNNELLVLDSTRTMIADSLTVGRGGGRVLVNSAFGLNALSANSSGIENTAIGGFSLNSNTASNNTGLGSYSGYRNTSGAKNTAIGNNANYDNLTGGENTAIGYQSLYLNKSNFNTSVGSNSSYSNTTGTFNTALGASALYNNQLGVYNTGLGAQAGQYFGGGVSAMSRADSSIFIGSLSRASADNQTNQVVIGVNAIGGGNNSVVLGNDRITSTFLKGNVSVPTLTLNGRTSLQGTIINKDSVPITTTNRWALTVDTTTNRVQRYDLNNKANTAGATFTDSLVLTSTVGGISLPSMTQTQMNAITPRLGTQIYNTTYDAVCTYTNDFGWWSNEQPWVSSNGFMVFDEFITYAYNSNQNGSFFQIQNSNGTWTSATPLSNRPGILQMSTGTNAAGRLTVQADGIGLASNIVGGGKLIYETDVQIPTLSSAAQTFSFFTGLNSVNTNVSTNSIAFLYDSAGVNTGSAAIGRWQVVCANGSTRSYTTTDSTVTAGRWYRLRAEINSAGNSVAFYINGTLVKTETNNIPTGALTYVSSLIKSNGTTARTAWVDFIRIRQKFTTPR